MTTENSTNQTPAELRAVEAALEDLARRERGAASPALEDRLFMISRGALPGFSAERVVVRRIVFLSRMRIAAALALVGGLGAGWLAERGSPAPAAIASSSERALRLEQDVEWLLAMRSNGEGLEGLADVLSMLLIDVETIDDALESDWPVTFDDGAGT